MPKFVSAYVKYVDLICEKIGRFVMYWVFFMMFLLILSFVTRNIQESTTVYGNPAKILSKSSIK